MWFMNVFVSGKHKASLQEEHLEHRNQLMAINAMAFDRKRSLAVTLRTPIGLTPMPSAAPVDAREVVARWMAPNALARAFYNRPQTVSFLKLFGPWLFEAAASGSTLIKEGEIHTIRKVLKLVMK